jgi:hypothetical protein
MPAQASVLRLRDAALDLAVDDSTTFAAAAGRRTGAAGGHDARPG